MGIQPVTMGILMKDGIDIIYIYNHIYKIIYILYYYIPYVLEMKKKPLAEYDRSVKQSETFGKSVDRWVCFKTGAQSPRIDQ